MSRDHESVREDEPEDEDREPRRRERDPDPPPRRTRAAEVADAVAENTLKLSRLTPQQVLTVIAVGIMAFVCSLQAFQVYSEREERKEIGRERQEWNATQMREQNAQSELTRQHCAAESSQLRNFFSDQNDRRMRFEADERAKDRAVLTALVARLADLEKAINRRTCDE